MMTRRPAAFAVAAFACLASVAAQAGNLRGAVEYPPPVGSAGPAGVAVILSAPSQPERRTVTSGSGYYFFLGVPPGNYVLHVGQSNYNVTVTSAPNQDIPPVVLTR
jgi:hypothetical protein